MPGGGTIHVLCENFLKKPEEFQGVPLQEGDYIKIIIKDEGVGIPEGEIENIFDPYFTTKQAGSGLGLAVVNSIIRKHHGHITCDSEIGKSTTFTVYLPATGELVAAEGVAAEVLSGQGRVMVMDDDELLRDLFEKMLESIGYEVVLACNGDEAVDLYARSFGSHEAIDLVIMDLTIPGGMGGKEAVRKLLEIDTEVKAIVASGYSNDPVMANYKEYGFKGVLVKPFNRKDLHKAVKSVLA